MYAPRGAVVSKNLAMAANPTNFTIGLDSKLKEIRKLVRGGTWSVGMIADEQTDCVSPKNVEEEFLKGKHVLKYTKMRTTLIHTPTSYA